MPARDAVPPLPAARADVRLYLNELVLKLTTRHDPQPELFDHYEDALAAMRAGEAAAPALRRFELRLLEQLGYGLDLDEACTGRPIEAGSYYHFHPALGFVGLVERARPAMPCRAPRCWRSRQERPRRAAALDDARRVLRAALDLLLEGRELRTRAVAQAVARRAASRPRPGHAATRCAQRQDAT